MMQNDSLVVSKYECIMSTIDIFTELIANLQVKQIYCLCDTEASKYPSICVLLVFEAIVNKENTTKPFCLRETFTYVISCFESITT